MIQVQNIYPVLAMNAQTTSTSGGSLVSSGIKLKGYKYATILVYASTAAATNVPTTLSITENDTNSTTGASAIPAFTGGTAVNTTSGFVIPPPQTAANTQAWAMFNVDARGRKEYLFVNVAPVAAQTVNVIALLSRADQSPVGTTTPANQNVSGIVVNG
jgi:hypothetical protein